MKQAGAELCQAQGKLRLASLLPYFCFLNKNSLVFLFEGLARKIRFSRFGLVG